MFKYLKSARAAKTPTTARSGPDPTVIVPLIKAVVHDDEPAIELSYDNSLLMRPFAADLVVMYAEDLPEHFVFLSNRGLGRLEMDEDTLHELALSNLPQRLPPIEIHGSGPTKMITAGGNFEATLLLFDPLWDQLALELPGELLAAVPCRDLLFVSSTGSAGGETFVRDMAAKQFEDSRYRLSTCTFVRRERRWVPNQSN